MTDKESTEPNEKWISFLTDDTEEGQLAETEKGEEKGQTEKRKGMDEGSSEAGNHPHPPVVSTSPNPALIESPFPLVSAPSALSEAEMHGIPRGHLPEQQRYHLWQNLDTGEYQYRPVRVDQPPSRIASRPLASPQMEYLPRRGTTTFPRPLQSPASLIRPPHFAPPSGGEQGKRPRTTWSGSLQAAFETAVVELGPNATPNPIRDRLREEGFDDITREQVSSHLQKHKSKQQNLKQKEQSDILTESKKEEDPEDQQDQDSARKSKEKTE